MNKTANYQLNQWDAEDKVQRTDFNADNAKIDAALKAQADALAGKAANSTVSSLQGSVNSISSILSQKGNCSTEVFARSGLTAVGSPITGATLTFSARPDAFFIFGDGLFMMGQGGAAFARGLFSDSMSGSNIFETLTASWSGSTMTLNLTHDRQNKLISTKSSLLIAAFRKVG